jgi:hypothetical protein
VTGSTSKGARASRRRWWLFMVFKIERFKEFLDEINPEDFLA